MRISLHIGLEKTGTSSIQQFLHLNRDALQARGIMVPRSLGERTHTGLFLLCCEPDNVDSVRARHGLFDTASLERVRKMYQARVIEETARLGSPERFLLTSEHLSSRFAERSEIERLARFLRFPEVPVEVILYLREQSALLPSYIGEELRGGASLPLKFLEPGPGETCGEAWRRRREQVRANSLYGVFAFDPLPFWFDFEAVVALWAGVFGAENLRLRLFDPAQFANGDLIDDFAEVAGLGPVGDLARPPPRRRSMRETGMAMLRAHNRANPPALIGGRMAQPGQDEVLRQAEAMEGPPARLSAADTVRIRRFFAASNAALVARYPHLAPLLEVREGAG